MQKFETTVSDFHEEVASSHISKYIGKCINQANFSELLKCKVYIERMDLKEYWWESYIKVQQKLKDIALQDKKDKLDKNEKEAALYNWLKICVNPEKNPNYDFYFEKERLDHEKQVKEILFDEKGALKDIFKSLAWQIRLRKIKIWFLKRYDWMTAFKMWWKLKNRRKFDFVDLIFPRLLCAILIGSIPLIMTEEVWRLALGLNWWEIGVIFLSAFIFVLLYFRYECFKTDRKIKSLFPRVFKVGLWGVSASLFFSTIFCIMFSHHFIDFESVAHDGLWYVRYLKLGPFFLAFHGKIIVFFATIALLIGILIQVIWEEKTITEPL
ncbi:TIGR02587 family membrane protein [Dehalococcoidia bacterium]|nr:TIGR02587 family membrane protein [Dehalococcoidia bacterium]